MGYTMSQIDKHYNDIVNVFKSMHFEEVPYSNRCYCGNIYRSVELSNKLKDTVVTHKITLNHGTLDDLDGFAYSVPYLDVADSVYVNGVHALENCYKRFYQIDSNYYTIHLSEVKHARDLHLKRYLDCIPKSHCCYIEVNKLSDKVINYFNRRIDTAMDKLNRSHDYKIKDVYFSYRGNSRRLVVVIKHRDNLGTEAIYFN